MRLLAIVATAIIALVGLVPRKDYMDILHPSSTEERLQEVESRLMALETHPQGYAQLGGTGTTLVATTDQLTSTTEVDLPNTSITLSLASSSYLIIIATGTLSVESPTADGAIGIYLYIDDVSQDDLAVFGAGTESGEVARSSFALHSIKNLGSGDHTIKLRYKVSEGTTEFYVFQRRISYMILSR